MSEPRSIFVCEDVLWPRRRRLSQLSLAICIWTTTNPRTMKKTMDVKGWCDGCWNMPSETTGQSMAKTLRRLCWGNNGNAAILMASVSPCEGCRIGANHSHARERAEKRAVWRKAGCHDQEEGSGQTPLGKTSPRQSNRRRKLRSSSPAFIAHWVADNLIRHVGHGQVLSQALPSRLL